MLGLLVMVTETEPLSNLVNPICFIVVQRLIWMVPGFTVVGSATILQLSPEAWLQWHPSSSSVRSISSSGDCLSYGDCENVGVGENTEIGGSCFTFVIVFFPELGEEQ